ncbi:MAG: hypothetical protein M3R25_04415 [Bacteroidota bacterium]|nr:hypothetical protein [Bacteroidota bacterium]
MKCSLLFLCICLSTLCQADNSRLEKKINREFTISTDGRVELNNRYGNIDVAIGAANAVKIDVVIAVTSASDKKAQETMDRITVGFEEGNNRISAKTDIDNITGWTSWFNMGKTTIEVNYHVQVPLDVYLDLTNRYGNIYLETTNRDLKVDLGYGDLRLGDVNGRLKLDMIYSDGSISQILDGDLQLSYSDLEMEDGENVAMDMKYTDIKSGTFKKLKLESSYSDWHGIAVNDLDYTGKYDDIVLDRVNQVTAGTAYSGINIAELTDSGTFDMRYGDLKLNRIRRSFTDININTSYTGCVLQFESETNYSIDAEVNYGEIYHTDIKISENIHKDTGSILRGAHGTGGGRINARMNYGELKLLNVRA